MRGFALTRFIALAVLVAFGVTGLSTSLHAAPENGLYAPQAGGAVGGKADFGVKRLEKLPWDVHVIRANLQSRGPLAVAGVYLMKRHLIIVSKNGRVYCLDKRNLQPRWVSTLKAPLAKVPTEGATYYTFLLKDSRGVNWIDSLHKRSGSRSERFPARLSYTTSSGLATNASMAFVGSLGSPRNNKTLESVNLITGRSGWGYRSSGLIYGDPQMDSSGGVLVFAGDDGVITALPARASAPKKGAMWERTLGGSVRGLAVGANSVYAGNSDGNLYGLDLFTGKVKWLAGTKHAIKSAPYVLGSTQTVSKSTGVEGASPIKVRRYVGTVFAKTVGGLHAFDAGDGKPLFRDTNATRPICAHGKYVVTTDRNRNLTFRDKNNEYKVGSNIDLGVFDLIPTNRTDGAIYAVTADGTVVAAIPRLR